MKLSERLEKLATELHAGCWDNDVLTCREAAALARRVEEAERVKVIETGGALIATATPAIVRAKAGDTLLLVPVEGGS